MFYRPAQTLRTLRATRAVQIPLGVPETYEDQMKYVVDVEGALKSDTSGCDQIARRGWAGPRLRLSHANAIISAPLLFIIAVYCIRVHYIVRCSSDKFSRCGAISCLIERNRILTSYEKVMLWLRYVLLY